MTEWVPSALHAHRVPLAAPGCAHERVHACMSVQVYVGAPQQSHCAMIMIMTMIMLIGLIILQATCNTGPDEAMNRIETRHKNG